MSVANHRILLCLAAWLMALPAAAQRSVPPPESSGTTDGNPAEGTPTDQKTQPDPGGQILNEFVKLMQEKARADARRRAEAERAKREAAERAKQDAAAAAAQQQVPKPVPVETKPAPVAPEEPPAKRAPPRVLKPVQPKHVLLPKPSLVSPEPNPLLPLAPEPPVVQQPIVVPPPTVRQMLPRAMPVVLSPRIPGPVIEDSNGYGIGIIAVIGAILAAGAGGIAMGRWLFAPPLPLRAKARVDLGTVSAPLFADDPPLPQVSFMVAPGIFTAAAEYPAVRP